MGNRMVVLLIGIVIFGTFISPTLPTRTRRNGTPPPTAEPPPSTIEPPPSISGITTTSQEPSVASQNSILLLATTVPIAIFAISVTIFTIIFVLIILVVYLKYKNRSRETNYPNVIVNPHTFSDEKGTENVPEPIYTEIPAFLMESPPNETNQHILILEAFGHLVEGEMVANFDNEFNPSNGLTINSIYNFEEKKIENEMYSAFVEPPKSPSEIESNLQYLQIRKEELELGERIASGHFGLVYRATYHTHKGDIPVAVKSLKQEANSDMTLAFMREAATLAQFNHPNVLRLIGVLSPQHQQPCMIVTELLRTELREFLLKLKHPNSGSSSSTRSSPQPQGVVLQALLLKFSQEIAAGMAYLAEKKFIHRDLAARNVLVAKDLTIRVADFGMSREMDSPENNYYTSSGGKVPLRWTAPEALLYMKYSEKSDVWAFGMTLYEIWSLGDKPWGSASNEEIIEALSTGRILSAPFGCPEDLYQVMMQTWTMEKTGRPTFNELKTILSNVNLSFYHKLSEIQ